MKKKILVFVLALLACQTPFFAGGFFDTSIPGTENKLRWSPAMPFMCISSILAYEMMLANQSVRGVDELEKQHQEKIDNATATLKKVVEKEQDDNLKQLNTIAVLNQLQAQTEKHKAFLVEQNNRIQNIVIDIRAKTLK